jgi:pimeloyl-ACP methyl ester carboxylesterase
MGIIDMNKIIILHGWTKNLDKWAVFIDALKKKGISAKLLKIPSLTEKLDKVWDLPDYVQWLKEIIDKETDKIILMGHSNGGRIALSFANSYPEKIKKLILIDSAGIYHNEPLLKIKRIVFRTIAKIGKKITSSENIKNLLYKLARESDYKTLDETTKKTMINLIKSDLKPILSLIKTPTLIIWGAEDKTTPMSDGILMNELIKNSKLKIVSEAKHSPMYTHTQAVAKIIYENI